ncbi:MAG: 1-phosphofructokinase family hexose kinase [Acidimicrobiia bacterium]
MNTAPTRVLVFAPDPVVTVTVEAGTERDEIHFHAGGQGVWVARMVAALGMEVSLCGPFGGEAGRVALALIASGGIGLVEVETSVSGGVYVHDRRSGERVSLAETPPEPLGRHDLDQLYGAALAGALDAAVCVLGGPGPWATPPIPPEVYRRLASDLSQNERIVIADLSGEALSAALAGGISVLKVSHEELIADGRATDAELATLVSCLRRLRDEGAEHVIVTRGAEPAVALVGDDVVQVTHPHLEAVEHRGAGDSLTAGIAAGLAQGRTIAEALRLGAAAGTLNVTRRGLATGNRRDIERLAEHVTFEALPG